MKQSHDRGPSVLGQTLVAFCFVFQLLAWIGSGVGFVFALEQVLLMLVVLVGVPMFIRNRCPHRLKDWVVLPTVFGLGIVELAIGATASVVADLDQWGLHRATQSAVPSSSDVFEEIFLRMAGDLATPALWGFACIGSWILDDSLRPVAVGTERKKTHTPKLVPADNEQGLPESSLQATPVLEPQLFAAYAIKGAAFVERGMRDFPAWSAQMLGQFGDALRPHLEELYLQSVRVFNQTKEQRTSPAAVPEDRSVQIVIQQHSPNFRDLSQRKSGLVPKKVCAVLIVASLLCLTFPYYRLAPGSRVPRDITLMPHTGYRFFANASDVQLDWSHTLHGLLWLSSIGICVVWIADVLANRRSRRN